MTSTRLVGVGAFVAGGLFLFALGLFMIGDRRMLFEGSISVFTEFETLAGLQTGAKVQVAGMDAGEVAEIVVPPGPEAKFRVRIRIRRSLYPLVRTDSVATIQSDGIVGNQFLQISAGSQAAPVAVADSVIPSREPFSFTDLLQDLSDTIAALRETVDDVELQLRGAIDKVASTAVAAGDLVEELGDDVKEITSVGNRIAGDIQSIVEQVRSGQGTLGRLVNEDLLYRRALAIGEEVESSATNIRMTTEQLQRISAEVDASAILQEAEETLQSLRRLTEQTREAIASFLAKDESGLGSSQDVRLTLKYAREAMANLAENTEALKRNFLFRGFFRNRGFFDLASLTVEDYRGGALLGRDRRVIRRWLSAETLFSRLADGSERLSDEGKKQLDSIMAEFLRYPSDSPLMVEGYATAGFGDQQFLDSRNRALLVQEYLVERFFLDRFYTGFLAMGSHAPESPTGDRWDGAAVALFVHRSAQPRP